MVCWGHVCTWLLVNTLKMCSSESGAKPWHSLILAITPATNVPWPRPEKQELRHGSSSNHLYLSNKLHGSRFSTQTHNIHVHPHNVVLVITIINKIINMDVFIIYIANHQPSSPSSPPLCYSSSPSSSVFSLVQLVLSFTFLKCGCFSLRPVSNTATFTPEPTHTHRREFKSLQQQNTSSAHYF